MPSTVPIGLLVLGGILILVAIIGGNFNLFGAVVSGTISNPYLRFNDIFINFVNYDY